MVVEDNPYSMEENTLPESPPNNFLKQDAKGVTYTNAQGEVKEYADAKLKFESAPLSMVNVIQIFMLLAGSLIIIFTKN